MNKKGDISITILVLGVVALCFLTIFSFITFKNNFNDDFSGIGLIETMKAFEEEENFFANSDFSRIGPSGFESGEVMVKNEGEKIVGEVSRGEFNFKITPPFFESTNKTIVRVEYPK
ncbi:MAG: hypothetical protein WDZ77_01035 [Candidatus Pacearchaeota archaeon]